MRAGSTESTGSAGQSLVKHQFEMLGWAALPNNEHDLGTDLWLNSRDRRSFDLGNFAGAQVKASANSSKDSKYFKQPVFDGDALTGWWFYEEKQDHFQAWIDHSVPHMVVLVDLSAQTSWWAHITSQSVVWTEKGGKVFVPCTQRIDDDNVDALLGFAASQRKPALWEGSAWTQDGTLAAPDELRYAMLAPRLVAPHPNTTPSDPTPAQAIATLVLMRLDEFEAFPYQKPVYPTTEDARRSTESGWRLFAALKDAILAGDRSHLDAVVDESAKSTRLRDHERCIAVVASAALKVESGDLAAADRLLENEIALDKQRPVDHAWLLVQRARIARELGDFRLARDLAFEAHSARQVAPDDPTSSAVSAAASQIIFSLSPWGPGALQSIIKDSDIVAAWWRSQLIGWGLRDFFDHQFRNWANDNPGFAEGDTTSEKLRAAALISGFTGDRGGWRQTMSMLARYTLATCGPNDFERAAVALDTLRNSGEGKDVEAAVLKMLRSGPAVAVRDVVARIDLEQCTASNTSTTFALLTEAADVIPPGQVATAVNWVLRTLEDPTPVARRTRLTYVGSGLGMALLKLLRALTRVVDETSVRDIINHILAAPVISDQALGEHYARVVDATAGTVWTRDDIERARARSGDHESLWTAFTRIAAGIDPTAAQQLDKRAADGTLDGLAARNDITGLSDDVAEKQITGLIDKVNAQLEAARKSSYGWGGVDVCRTLTLMNMSYPHLAKWEPIVELLIEPMASGHQLQPTIVLLAARPTTVPASVAESLIEPLRRWTSASLVPTAMGPQTVAGPAYEALEALCPGTLTTQDMLALMSSDRDERCALVRIIRARRRVEDFGVLTTLLHDRDALVRGTSAQAIADWAANGDALPDSLTTVAECMTDGTVGIKVDLVLADTPSLLGEKARS
ncbi:DUF4365 domain-containing protein [Rhodococcus sp. C26F]